jgi:hypothetical protein
MGDMEWISVEDEQPPIGVNLLVTDVNNKFIRKYDNKLHATVYIVNLNQSSKCRDWQGISHTITHWMALPEPPLISN